MAFKQIFPAASRRHCHYRAVSSLLHVITIHTIKYLNKQIYLLHSEKLQWIHCVNWLYLVCIMNMLTIQLLHHLLKLAYIYYTLKINEFSAIRNLLQWASSTTVNFYYKLIWEKTSPSELTKNMRKEKNKAIRSF